MIVTLHTQNLRTLIQVQAFVSGNEAISLYADGSVHRLRLETHSSNFITGTVEALLLPR